MSEVRRRWILIAMSSVLTLVMLDESAVAVVLTEIRAELGLSRTATNWVLTAYLVSLSSTVAAFGRLADVVGLKAVLIGGCLVFGATSIGAGLAENASWLVFWRVIQGLGAAAAFPAAAGIVRSTTPPERLGRALGYFGLSSAVGLMMGPLVGGLLAEVLSWRYVFFLSAPIVVFIVIVTWLAVGDLDRHGPAAGHRFDWPGGGLLVCALAALIGGLMQGPVWGWTSVASLATFSVALAAAALFVWVENDRANSVVEIDLFRAPTFRSANATTLFAQFAKTSVIVYGPYYLIEVLGMSPFDAGKGLLPGIFVAMFAGPAGGRMADRMGPRAPALAALVILAFSLFYLAYAVTGADYRVLVPGLILWGCGASAMFAASRRAVQDSVPASKTGQASGINSTAQWLGAALSVPILGVFVHGHPHFSRLYLAAGLIIVAATVSAFLSLDRPARRGRTV